MKLQLNSRFDLSVREIFEKTSNNKNKQETDSYGAFGRAWI